MTKPEPSPYNAYESYPPSPPRALLNDHQRLPTDASDRPLTSAAQGYPYGGNEQAYQQYPQHPAYPVTQTPAHMLNHPNDPSFSPTAVGAHPHHAHPYSSIMHETEQELTEDEREAYEDGILTWDKAKNWRFWIRKEWTWYYIAFVLLVVVVALMAIFHHQIINWLTPFTRRLQTIKVGWLIPVAILFVLSFPPLFGNGKSPTTVPMPSTDNAEIVMILVGIVWGLGVGFAIVAAGISLGEIANYFVFKYWCSARAERMTKKSLNYACLTQVVRDGGFWMAFMIRLSAIPTHFSTVLFAVCGLPFWQYCLALVAGLPKQLIAVYVGVVLAGSAGDTSGKTPSTAISDSVFAVTAIITLASLYYIYRKMIGVRKKVLISMRADLQGKGVNVVDEVPETGSSSGSGQGIAPGIKRV